MRSFTVATALSENLEPKSATLHSHLISQQCGLPQGLSFFPYSEGLTSLSRDTEVCWSHGGLRGVLSRIHEWLLAAHGSLHNQSSALRWQWVLTKRVASHFVWYYGPLFWPLAQMVIWLLPKPTGSLTPLIIPEPSAPVCSSD